MLVCNGLLWRKVLVIRSLVLLLLQPSGLDFGYGKEELIMPFPIATYVRVVIMFGHIRLNCRCQ